MCPTDSLCADWKSFLRLFHSVDVKQFLTFLAVTKKVSASTQNQAFNALFFFYRHVLDKEFGKIEGIVRAKRKPYIPVVLSREEIDAILMRFSPPLYRILIRFYVELYGGLRKKTNKGGDGTASWQRPDSLYQSRPWASIEATTAWRRPLPKRLPEG